VLLKQLFHVDLARETAELAARDGSQSEALEHWTLRVTNPNLDGVRLDAIPGRNEAGVTVARVRHGEATRAATDSAQIHLGDRIAVVGTRAGLEQFARVVGQRTDEDLVLVERDIKSRRVVVTDRTVLGRAVGDVDFDDRFGVAVTRITRADIEMPAVPGLRLQFGDTVEIVGRDADLDRAAEALGNSLEDLNATHFIPLFIGLALGIALGTLPIPLPGLPQPLRIGLAGGPLLVALLLGRVGRIGRLVWHMPANTNLAFREFGIALFLAAAGLDAGGKFFATAFSSTGLKWLLSGICVTVLPPLLVGIYARLKCKMLFVDVAGLLAGSMTDPPTLAFASNIAASDAPTVVYATVYPLSMLLRIVCAQVLAVSLTR